MARLAQLVGTGTADLCVQLRPTLDHQSNRLYDVWVGGAGGRHLIVKEFLKPDEFATAPLREYRALELVAPLDIAPKPVAVVPGPEPPLGPLVVYEFLEGSSWDRRRRSAAELVKLAELWLDGGGPRSFDKDGRRAEPWVGVWVDDVDAVYERLKAAGVAVDPPGDKPYGVRMLSVTDPEGHRWGFMRRLD